MPRKIGTAKLSEFDLRITPTDGKPITKDEFMESDLKAAERVIVGQEGGTPQLRLHYHLYVKGNLSETTIAKICSKLGRATQDIKGNAVFSVRQAHSHTIGYVVKNKDIIWHTDSQQVLEQYFKESDQYKREKETERKRASRKENSSLVDILKEVEVDGQTSVADIVAFVLQYCHNHDLKFPNKNMLETAVLKRIYPFQPQYVQEYYMRNFNTYFR